MLKRCLSMVVALALVNSGTFPVLSARGQALPSADAKADILALGVQQSLKLKIDLTDRSSVQGWVASVDDESFSFAMKGSSKTIAYRDVTRVRKATGLSTGAKVAIGAGIVGGLLVLLRATMPLGVSLGGNGTR